MNSGLIPSIGIVQSALNAERTRLDVIASNLANSQTTRDANGNVYRRKEVVFESLLPAPAGTQDAQSGLSGVHVAKIIEDPSPLPKIHMPGHPHADANGMVTFPNVNVVEEMVDMMTASRSYEANLQVLHSAKQIFTNSMRIVES